ncbi:hypothetical protein [Bifidobacterium sp.]|uniref:hypothetical protein n=1 Tax=Bifidobacterium sp. TaxID=41200 RepID=UPI0039E75F06
MAGKVKFVLDRKEFSKQILHNKKLMDDVHEQIEGMAQVHEKITVYRNEDGNRTSIVATAPAAVEAEHGVLTQMLGMVKV